MIKIMSNEEFCKMVTAYDGEVVDHINQIGLRSFNGEDLKEFIELCFELKNNGDLGDVRQRYLSAIEDIDYNAHAEGCGLEDNGITDRYDALAYGYEQGLNAAFEAVDNVA